MPASGKIGNTLEQRFHIWWFITHVGFEKYIFPCLEDILIKMVYSLGGNITFSIVQDCNKTISCEEVWSIFI